MSSSSSPLSKNYDLRGNDDPRTLVVSFLSLQDLNTLGADALSDSFKQAIFVVSMYLLHQSKRCNRLTDTECIAVLFRLLVRENVHGDLCVRVRKPSTLQFVQLEFKMQHATRQSDHESSQHSNMRRELWSSISSAVLSKLNSS